MTHAISNAQLCKLLDDAAKADREHEAAKQAVTDAQMALNRCVTRRNKAHEAAVPHVLKERGLTLHDSHVWRVVNNRVVSEPIGRDLNPHQESLLREPAQQAA